ncbi:anthrone oxygenase family protein [Paractinoplanes rishiriensis]|uniref:Membrane protein n=1 Tax=Paractinoplanes rishiriensis TaxID=1050105 RepID=A0A919JUG2_9ACTN|nr:anthrone oxygenase family protein [Actinoplanes rishiriensis]GIE94993.1 membrane protein [Actinoplanes rishiriensis]
MRIAVLLAATVTTGMMAGLFYAYSISVMPALQRADAAVFVEVMQRINTAITNGWFLSCFGGALVFGAISTILYAVSGLAAVFVPALIGLALYAAQLALTFGLHIPLNNALDAAGPPGHTADPGAVRRAFEPRWVPWNHARTLLCLGSFAAFCWALVQA